MDVSSGSERRAGSSYQNPREASFVSAFLARLVASGLRSGRGVKAGGGGGGDGTAAGGGRDREKSGVVRVGVITPYRGQVHCIQQELSGGGGGRRLKGGVEDGGVDAEVSAPPTPAVFVLRVAAAQTGNLRVFSGRASVQTGVLLLALSRETRSYLGGSVFLYLSFCFWS